MIESTVHAAIAVVCPIDGLSFGTLDDPATWAIQYQPQATDTQRAAAIAALARFTLLAMAQAARCAWIDTQREAEIAAGIQIPVAGVVHPFQTAPASRANLAAVVAAVAGGMALPAGFSWRDSDNVDVPMDAPTLNALGAAVVAHAWQCHQQARALKAAVAAAADVAAVNAVTWPSP
jgi:hypothetical protein